MINGTNAVLLVIYYILDLLEICHKICIKYNGAAAGGGYVWGDMNTAIGVYFKPYQYGS